MILKKLDLQGFRSYRDKEFEFSKGINLVVANNGVGKTNLLEAVCLLSIGESFRKGKIDDLVAFGSELGQIRGNVENVGEEYMLKVIVSRGVVSGKRVAKRLFRLDDLSKRKTDFVGNLVVILFRPEDMEFVLGSPSFRRTSVDRLLMQISSEYRRSLMAYERALRRRNRVLFFIREGRGKADRQGLAFWDGLLVKHGRVLTEMRGEWVEFVNNLWKRSELFVSLGLEYKKSVVSESILEEKRELEIVVGSSLVGPHKDDFLLGSAELFSGDEMRSLAIYGSRGEQRMGILALKMGELYFAEKKLKIKPVLLLDDVFSELDETHRKEVVKIMQGRQVIVTTAEKGELKRFGEAKNILL